MKKIYRLNTLAFRPVSAKIYDGYYTYQHDGRGLAVMDIDEIIKVKNKPSNVNVVIETGGSYEWTKNKYGKYGDYDIDASKLQIHHVNSNNKLSLDKSLNYSSMGDSSTLQSFLEYGFTKYPAEKTALVLWNHGGGLQGVCFDEKTNDALSAHEVSDAVDNALKSCNMEGQKLEWIGYDACLMAVQDIAEINSKHFNYMISSQEAESAYGWSYSSWIDDVYKHEDTETILKAICDGFIASTNMTYGRRYNDQTLAYYDLSKAEAYRDAWENMAIALSDKVGSYNDDDFNDLVNSCKSYADDAYVVYGLFDAMDFITKLSESSEFNPGEGYIENLTNAFNDLVVYNNKGQAAGNSNGLSMYYAISTYTSRYNSYTSSDTNFTNWSNLIARVCD